MVDRVKNKIALVTGAAQGLGKTMSELLIQEGAQVILTDINEDLLEKTATEVGAPFKVLDVTEPKAWQNVIAEIEKDYGKLHVLINNAGIGAGGDIESCDLETWEKVHKVDLDSVFFGCKFSLPLMRKSGNGSIINISSISGIVAGHNMAAYNSAKAGVRHLSKSVALHCARSSDLVRCNSIHPAFTKTDILNDLINLDPSADIEGKLVRQIPIKRLGQPIDVAYAALFLASDESSFITGTEIILDGGLSACLLYTSPSPRD